MTDSTVKTGAESAMSNNSRSGMGNKMVPVDKEQNSAFFKKPLPAGEQSLQLTSKAMNMDFSCKFDKWMPALTTSGRICIKGKVKGITNSLLVTEPVVHRFSNSVVAGSEGIFRLGTFMSAGLPSFIAEKFKNGFPQDWSALCKTWFNFKQQGEPESFTWKQMLWNSINVSPDSDGEKEYSADIESDGERSVVANKMGSDADQSVSHSSPSELLSILKRKRASLKNKPSMNASKNMTKLEETPKSFSRRRYSRNLSFYASLSQSVEQKSILLNASPHQTPDACTDICFKSGVICCSTPLVALKNIPSVSNDKQTQGHIVSPTHDIVTPETSDQMDISLKENLPDTQNKNSRCTAKSQKKSDVSFVTPLHTSHKHSMQNISVSFSQQASKSNCSEKLPRNNNSLLTHASKHSPVNAIKHNQSSHNYTLRSKSREKVVCSVESSEESMPVDSHNYTLRSKSREKVVCSVESSEESMPVDSHNYTLRSKSREKVVGSVESSKESMPVDSHSYTLRSKSREKAVCSVESSEESMPVDSHNYTLRSKSREKVFCSMESSEQSMSVDEMDSVDNQREVESKLSRLSINTPKVNVSNIKDTAGKQFVANSSREKSINNNLEDVAHIHESPQKVSTNDGDHHLSVKIPQYEFKVPQALSPLVMVQKLEDRLGTRKISGKPQMMQNWTPVLIPLTKPGFRLQGQLRRLSLRKPTRALHITKPVRKVLTKDTVTTTDGQIYQLIGPAVETPVVPESILSQFANGIPKNWSHVLQQWKREHEVPVPQMKAQESMTSWSRSSFSSSVVSSTSLDNLQGIAGLSRSRRGRIIVPQLSYWLGERVKKAGKGPIYECNSSVSLLSDSTSTSLVSDRGRKKRSPNQFPTTRQGTDSENGEPTTIPTFCSGRSEWRVGVKGSEEDKDVPNGQNMFPVTRSISAAKDGISKKLLGTPASEEHPKQKLTVNRTGSIPGQENEVRKGVVPKEKLERKFRRIIQKELESDDSEQENSKNRIDRSRNRSKKKVKLVEELTNNKTKKQGYEESRRNRSNTSLEKQGQSSEQEHSKSLDSEDVEYIELSEENIEGTRINGSRSQYKQECFGKGRESRKNLFLKEKNRHYETSEKSSRSRSHSLKRLVAQENNSEQGENSVHKDEHCEKLPRERLRSRSQSIKKLNECGELPRRRDKSTNSSIDKDKNVNTQEKDMGNNKVQNHPLHYEDADAQIRSDCSQENLKQKQKSSSTKKSAKSGKSRHLITKEVEDDKTSPVERHGTVLSTPDASQKKEPFEKTLFELPFEVKRLRTMKQRQLADDKLLKMQKAIAVNTDFFGDPECPYNIEENSSKKALTYSDILNEAKRDRQEKSNASSCSAITPPAKYYEKILHRAVPLTPCRSPPIEPPIYNRKDVLSRIQHQVQAPVVSYQMEVKTNQKPCEDSIQLRMDMEKKRKEYIIPGYDIKVRYTNDNVSDDDDDDGGSSFSESQYSGPL